MPSYCVSGLEIVRDAKRRYPHIKICVHSNYSDVVQYREAIAAGADAFLPKPMSRDHLLGLLV